jgi:hypothetical protein
VLLFYSSLRTVAKQASKTNLVFCLAFPPSLAHQPFTFQSNIVADMHFVPLSSYNWEPGQFRLSSMESNSVLSRCLVLSSQSLASPRADRASLHHFQTPYRALFLVDPDRGVRHRVPHSRPAAQTIGARGERHFRYRLG